MRQVSRTLLHISVVLSSVILNVFAQFTVVSYNVREERDRLYVVGNVARDSLLYSNVSMEEFQRMKFQILNKGNKYASMFIIDESASTLRTNESLDREKICEVQDEESPQKGCVFNFTVAVYKNAPQLDLDRLMIISITLEDINDNAPEFPDKDVPLTISENTPVNTEYFINGANDPDTGVNNSVQRYVMDPPNEMFGLREQNSDSFGLYIVVRYPLDRETRNSYKLVIYAIDGGDPQRTGSVNINVIITDQNDNAPIFSLPKYNITVQENTPENSTIVHVSATDSDAGENGVVSYRFSSRTSSVVKDMFKINTTTGRITSKHVLDYEQHKHFTFKIEAYDNGSPPNKTSVNVIINIADINDNYPEININQPPGGFKISESADKGSFVAHVAVSDRDAGINGNVKCKVHGDDFRLEDFKIENNYKVVLNKSLDHEVKNSYEVSIQCEDGGKPPKTNATSFIVKVLDINDNFPRFSKQKYELTVQENIVQSALIRVSATDADSGDNGLVTYGLHADAIYRFTVNSQTGLIMANNVKFDREVDGAQVVIQVMAWDSGEIPLTSTATVIINITDVNDNAPTFPSNPLDIHFIESEHPQSTFLGVLDPDDGLNGQFVLTFPHNDYLSKYFTFNSSTGEIRTVKDIDRELVPYFRFSVKAVDRGIPQMTSSAEVIVHIDDINDNIPAITYPNNGNGTRKISVTTPVGFVIATVEATDKDEGLNAQLLYFIDSGDTKELFNMDVNTGQISIARDMIAADAGTYKLELAVRDNGEVQRTSWAKLKVVIQPSNDTAASSIGEENKQNMTIVAVFVAVTGVLSIAIIVAIFIIRYIDRRNRPPPPPKISESKYYETARIPVDESMSASSNVSKDSDTELLKKRAAKKEVSFSIDDDSDQFNNSTLTNVTSFTTMKTPPSYMSMDYKPEDSSSSTWLCSNNTSSDLSKSDLYSEKELSSLSHSQLQKALAQIHGDKLWLQPVQEEQTKNMLSFIKKADDNHSQTSHDTTTSDSGRGGSEEDIHSNRGHPLSDTEDGRHYYSSDNRQRSKSGKVMPRRLPPPIPTESYPRNISFSDDSVTANTTVGSLYRLPSTSSVSSGGRTPRKQHELFTISGHGARDTFLDSQMTSPGAPYSIMDIEEMSEMATTCRDDASTTTSGSYTINPEDLCNEIDELFFKDDVIV